MKIKKRKITGNSKEAQRARMAHARKSAYTKVSRKEGQAKARQTGTITIQKWRNAVRDSYGNKTIIAERLKCARSHINTILNNRPAYLKVFKDEEERVGDLAENTVRDIIETGMESNKLKASTWVLDRTRPDKFQNNKNYIMDQKGTILHQHNVKLQQVDLSQLPLETRIQLLEHMRPEATPIEATVIDTQPNAPSVPPGNSSTVDSEATPSDMPQETPSQEVGPNVPSPPSPSEHPRKKRRVKLKKK